MCKAKRYIDDLIHMMENIENDFELYSKEMLYSGK
jgi:hypothetical protein